MTTSLSVNLELKSGNLVLRYVLRVVKFGWASLPTKYWAELLDPQETVIRRTDFKLKESGNEPWHLLAAALAALHLIEDGIVIPGWRCSACNAFHATGPGHGAVTEGKAKAPRTACRSCGTPREVG